MSQYAITKKYVKGKYLEICVIWLAGNAKIYKYIE